MPTDDQRVLACPSSRATTPRSEVFAIVDNRGPFPIIRYLEKPVAATPEVLALAEDEDPNQVFRITSPCQGTACRHFSQGECELPAFLHTHLPVVEGRAAPCPIRSSCRWFRQESFGACSHCSAVVTGAYATEGQNLLSPPLPEPEAV